MLTAGGTAKESVKEKFGRRKTAGTRWTDVVSGQLPGSLFSTYPLPYLAAQFITVELGPIW